MQLGGAIKDNPPISHSTKVRRLFTWVKHAAKFMVLDIPAQRRYFLKVDP